MKITAAIFLILMCATSVVAKQVKSIEMMDTLTNITYTFKENVKNSTYYNNDGTACLRIGPDTKGYIHNICTEDRSRYILKSNY
jgi:hypothetical protein